MYDKEARHIIEALRSGVPSRAVGEYFSEARPRVMKEISGRLDMVCEQGKSSGMTICGKYGEGKTHLLNTYLPRRRQPGFIHELEKISAGSPIANEMLLYAAKHPETDKLYYLLRSYLNTEDSDEKFLLQADLEGEFITNASLKKIYRRIFGQPVKYNVNFSKTKHCRDYFSFMSHLFTQMGYHGWVILFDETELMGKLGKKTRLKAYNNMADFLLPELCPESLFTIFALSASYVEDVIEGKHEYANLEEVFPENQEPARTVLNLLSRAPQLLPLTKDEISEVLCKIQDFHGKAYERTPDLSSEALFEATQSGGYLLRTKIRAAIEFLDQLYQYGKAGHTTINELGQETFTEDIPSLEELE